MWGALIITEVTLQAGLLASHDHIGLHPFTHRVVTRFKIIMSLSTFCNMLKHDTNARWYCDMNTCEGYFGNMWKFLSRKDKGSLQTFGEKKLIGSSLWPKERHGKRKVT